MEVGEASESSESSEWSYNYSCNELITGLVGLVRFASLHLLKLSKILK